MVEEELRDGQQRPHPRRVPAEARVQGLQAGQGAVQEGGVLPAEHVQHQHGLHQVLRGRRDTGTRGGLGWSPGGQRALPTPHLQLSAGLSPPSSGLLQKEDDPLVSVSVTTVNEGRTVLEARGEGGEPSGSRERPPGVDETLGQMPGRAGDSFCPLPGSPGSTSGTQSPPGKERLPHGPHEQPGTRPRDSRRVLCSARR